jgi:hypothetical protein
MTQAIDADITEIKTAIAANSKAIVDLTQEMRLGFANVENKFTKLDGRIDNLETKLVGKIDHLETKLTGQINTAEAKLTGQINQLDERTKLGFWGFIFRGTALAALAALTAIFVKYLFPILPEIPKT